MLKYYSKNLAENAVEGSLQTVFLINEAENADK